MTTVSIQEMRFEFAKVKRALESGQELLLTFRNRPLARLSPVSPQRRKLASDPALHFGGQAEDLPVLTNKEIDAALYG
jgi:antitoxin (DNA-binding transcriptional repressor) of toxin-antitoxin stability system